MNQRVIVVGPFCPSERGGSMALGAAAKISAVVAGLVASGKDIVLVNSGHQTARFSFPKTIPFDLNDAQRVREYHPLTLPSRSLGKAVQAIFAPYLGIKFSITHKPAYIWLYNPYIFEALFALAAKFIRPSAKIILEYEDAAFSRSRSSFGGLKNRLDQLGLKLVAPRASCVTLVNMALARTLPPTSAVQYYLPYLYSSNMPARLGNGVLPLAGYFGGLSEEKGARLLLNVIVSTLGCCRWAICGNGELRHEFKALAESYPTLVSFYGALPEKNFRSIYADVEAILTLHAPTHIHADGIFPYKILEAVANEKLLISTREASAPAEIEQAVWWVEPSVQAASEAIRKLRKIGATKAGEISAAARWTRQAFHASEVVPRILLLADKHLHDSN